MGGLRADSQCYSHLWCVYTIIYLNYSSRFQSLPLILYIDILGDHTEKSRFLISKLLKEYASSETIKCRGN